MEKLLAFFDTDALYAARFMEYFKKSNVSGFDITIFTKADSLYEFLQHQKLEILLISEELLSIMPKGDNIKYVFCLTGQKGGNDGLPGPSIYKYRAAGEVLKDITACYMRLENEASGGRINGSSNIISIYSPVPAAASITFAWAMADNLSEMMKTLFIPLELFPVPVINISEAADQALSDFIYYLKENNPGLSDIMKPLLSYTGKLSYLSGLTHGFDLLSLNKEDAANLSLALRNNTHYEAVAFYLGFYNEFTVELMNLSDRVYITTDKNPYEKGMLEELGRQMALMDIDIRQDKYKNIYLPEEALTTGNVSAPEELRKEAVWQYAKQLADDLQISHTE